MRKNFERIISETIENYISRNILSEGAVLEFTEADDGKESSDSSKDGNESDSDKDSGKKFRKSAIKKKGGLRGDYDVDYDEKYNKTVSDVEQSTIEDVLNSGLVNVAAVARKLYGDTHTPEGAQSQLSKKLRHDKSDSGSTYKLKDNEAKKLKSIIATELK
jgi:hypothetical protein